MVTPIATTPETAPDVSQAPPSIAAPAGDDHASKIRTLFGILRQFIGVPDMATVRFSLPSQLLEPIPNLEYWNYVDRPDAFASIGDSDDELGRFLAVMRFWFTKDLKLVKGKPCKPYNSTLGEFFRCHWDVNEPMPPIEDVSRPNTAKSSAKNGSIKSQTPITSTNGTTSTGQKLKVLCLTEQTSHHPPISAFVIDCPGKGVTARGYDQISAKFTGTSVRISAGQHNLGIFITLHNRGGELYRLTHPVAHLGGFLKGSLNVYVQDACYITCPKTKLKCIINYLADSWIGKPKHRVEGVIYHYDHEQDNIEKIKDVPKDAIRARIEGSWMGKLYYTVPGSSTQYLLVDLDPLLPATKLCPSETDMLPNESRKVWQSVSAAIHAKEFSKATKIKQEIEERQRQKAAARSQQQVEWKPRFFVVDSMEDGQPMLTREGEEVLRNMQMGRYEIVNGDGSAVSSEPW